MHIVKCLFKDLNSVSAQAPFILQNGVECQGPSLNANWPWIIGDGQASKGGNGGSNLIRRRADQIIGSNAHRLDFNLIRLANLNQGFRPGVEI